VAPGRWLLSPQRLATYGRYRTVQTRIPLLLFLLHSQGLAQSLLRLLPYHLPRDVFLNFVVVKGLSA